MAQKQTAKRFYQSHFPIINAASGNRMQIVFSGKSFVDSRIRKGSVV